MANAELGSDVNNAMSAQARPNYVTETTRSEINNDRLIVSSDGCLSPSVCLFVCWSICLSLSARHGIA